MAAADGRSALIHVTPAGSRQRAAMRAQRMERLAAVFADWSEDERLNCATTIRRLNRTLATLMAAPKDRGRPES